MMGWSISGVAEGSISATHVGIIPENHLPGRANSAMALPFRFGIIVSNLPKQKIINKFIKLLI
jgi:hypothetical protein